MQTVMTAAVFMSVTPRAGFAEVFDPLRGYGFDGTPVGPSRQVPVDRRAKPAEAAPQGDRRLAPSEAPSYVSPATVRRVASRSGFRLTDQPRRHGRAYVATGEDDKGHRYRLIFSAYNGQLVNRTDLGVIETAKPAAPTAPAATVADKPVEQAVKTAAAVPAPSSSPPEPYSAPTPVYTEMPPPPVVAAKPEEAPANVASVTPPALAPAPVEQPVAAAHVVPTPANPPAAYAAVNPCEITPAGAAPKSTAASAPAPNASVATAVPVTPPAAALEAATTVAAPPRVGEGLTPRSANEPTVTRVPEPVTTDAANTNSPPEPYHAPTPVYADMPAETPTSETANAAPTETGSIPASTRQIPPEPYSAPNWSDISGQTSSEQTDGKP